MSGFFPWVALKVRISLSVLEQNRKLKAKQCLHIPLILKKREDLPSFWFHLFWTKFLTVSLNETFQSYGIWLTKLLITSQQLSQKDYQS